MMSRIHSWHWKISPGCHFQNGHHNTAKIQHSPISSKFDMWVDNDVSDWFLTSKNVYRSPFSKWPPQYRTNSTLSDFNDISYVGRLWCPEMIPDIEKFLPVAIFKMAATIPHKFNIVRFQRPELIPDIGKFLPVSIFKLAHTIPQKFKVAFNLIFKPVVSGVLVWKTDANYFNTEPGLPIGIENFSRYRFIYLFIYFDPAVFNDKIWYTFIKKEYWIVM